MNKGKNDSSGRQSGHFGERSEPLSFHYKRIVYGSFLFNTFLVMEKNMNGFSMTSRNVNVKWTHPTFDI